MARVFPVHVGAAVRHSVSYSNLLSPWCSAEVSAIRTPPLVPTHSLLFTPDESRCNSLPLAPLYPHFTPPMHVKEQVKEFVHDVKRRFSHKRKRDTCSTFDSFDGASSNSGADTLSHLDDSSSGSSVSSLQSTREPSRFIKFIRRKPSVTSTEHPPNVLHKGRRADGKQRYRLFSAPTVPSERMVEPGHKQAASFPGLPGSSRDTIDEATLGSLQEDYSDVLDISARGSPKTGSATPTQAWSCEADRDSLSQSQPQFDTESQSDASGTLITSFISGAVLTTKSASESDSRFDSLALYSDVTSDDTPDTPHVSTLIDPMADAPPLPPPKSEQEEEIALAHSISSPPTAAPPPPRPATPAQLVRSTSESPPPVYIPRLTAPSMFLPIPNVRLIFPLSHSLLWWLAPKWSSGSRLSWSTSLFLPHSRNTSTFVSPQLRRSRSHPTPLPSRIQISSPHHPHARANDSVPP